MATDDRRAYLERLLAGDLDGARRLVQGFLGRRSPERLILDILAPAQTEIGQRWETNRCSVADEHVATSITDAVLAEVAATIPPPAGEARIAVACAEGDWHTVPARMAAELLRAQGYAIRFLGGSLPADHLEGYLVKLQPAVLVLSCSLPLFLPGALRSIEAAHRAAVPVMAGGRGFGPDEHAAFRLGADAWARSIPSSKRRLDLWSRRGPRELAAPAVDIAGWSALELAGTELVDHSIGLLVDGLAWMAQLDERQMARTREDLAYIFRYLAVSILVDDDRIFVEFLVWLKGVLTSRGLPPDTVATTLPVLTKALLTAGRMTPKIDRLMNAATNTLVPATSPAQTARP
jgi:methanogenic corrinoid protein MtbC1